MTRRFFFGMVGGTFAAAAGARVLTPIESPLSVDYSVTDLRFRSGADVAALISRLTRLKRDGISRTFETISLDKTQAVTIIREGALITGTLLHLHPKVRAGR